MGKRAVKLAGTQWQIPDRADAPGLELMPAEQHATDPVRSSACRQIRLMYPAHAHFERDG
jgi:hypothetical protein